MAVYCVKRDDSPSVWVELWLHTTFTLASLDQQGGTVSGGGGQCGRCSVLVMVKSGRGIVWGPLQNL